MRGMLGRRNRWLSPISLLFHHPAVWWISRRIRDERENCCDDLALAVCGDRLTYARALTQVEQLGVADVGLAAAATGGSLLRRIRRIAGLPDRGDDHSSRWLAGAVAITAVVALTICTHIAACTSAAGESLTPAAVATQPARGGSGSRIGGQPSRSGYGVATQPARGESGERRDSHRF